MAGWRGRVRRWPTSCGSSSRTTGCSRAASSIDDRLLTLADIATPILSVVGTVDEIAPAAGRARDQPGGAARRRLRAGDPGRATSASSSGRLSNDVTWPTVAGWVRWRDGVGERPEGDRTSVPDDPRAELEPETGHNRGRSRDRAGRRGRLGDRALDRARPRHGRRATCTELSREAASQLPRIIRSEQVGPRDADLVRAARRPSGRSATRTSCCSCSRIGPTPPARSTAGSTTSCAGLISIGVRQGEHVGVLMGPRPSGLAVVAALSRLGAVAVLLRPDGNTRREATLGQVRRIIADPERAAQAAGRGQRPHVRARRGRRAARPRRRGDDRHGADRPGRGPAAGLVQPESGARVRPGVRAVHRRGREHADEPDHERPLGHLGARDRLIGRPDLRRHGLQRDAAAPPVGADDGRSAARLPAARGSRWRGGSTRRRSGTRCAATA